MTGFVPPPSRLFIWLLLIAVYREFKCARQDAPEVLREAKQGGNGWLDNTKNALLLFQHARYRYVTVQYSIPYSGVAPCFFNTDMYSLAQRALVSKWGSTTETTGEGVIVWGEFVQTRQNTPESVSIFAANGDYGHQY
jgi:hypothetical protein